VNKNVSEAPCDEANLIGLFSLRFKKSDPIPKFKETTANVINPMFIEDARNNGLGSPICEK
jgi:hypothetical protein